MPWLMEEVHYSLDKRDAAREVLDSKCSVFVLWASGWWFKSQDTHTHARNYFFLFCIVTVVAPSSGCIVELHVCCRPDCLVSRLSDIIFDIAHLRVDLEEEMESSFSSP